MATGSRTAAGWYAYFFFHELIPIYPLYGIMFGEYGMSPLQLSALFSTWAVAGLLAEIPSGALADKYPRPTLLALASLSKAATYAVWLVLPSFWGFWFGFLFWGLSGALRSGTAEAYLHDRLVEQNAPEDFTRIYGRSRAVSTVAIGVAMFAGSRLVRYGYPLVLCTSIASLLVAASIAIVCFRETVRHEPHSGQSYLVVLHAGLREAVSNPSALFVVLLSLLVLPLAGAFDEFVGPSLHEKGFPRETVAALFATIYLAQIGGMLAAHRIRRAPAYAPLLILSAAGGVLFAASFGRDWAVPAAMAAYFGLFSLAATLFAGRLQSAIQGASRATVTSVCGAASSLGGILTFTAFGALATGHTHAWGIAYVAAVTATLPWVFIVLARRWRLR